MRVDGAAVRCTEEEAADIVGNVGLEVLQRVHRQCDGWMAGLVLFREHVKRARSALEQSLGEGKDAVFQYFASEIFNGATLDHQRLLMIAAVPPSITEHEAIVLTGSDEAPRLLEYFYRRHLFIDRRRGAHTTYHFHALFREFLQSQLARRLSQPERRDVQSRAAELLSKRGEASEALELFREAGEWERLRALIHANALDWARQGRAQALSEWIDALPENLRDNDPWLGYWIGRAWVFVQPKRGLPALEHAFEAFRKSGDVKGQALALNTLVTGYYYEWLDFKPLDRWLPELERLLDTADKDLDRASALRANAACLVALMFRRPDDDRLAQCARTLDELIDLEPDSNARIMAASTLLNYYNWMVKGVAADALVARVDPLLARADVTPLMQIWWRMHVAYWHYLHLRYDESMAVTAAARGIAERFGLERHLFETDRAEAAALIAKGEASAARARVEAIERRLTPSRPMEAAYFYHLRSSLAQRTGRLERAVEDAEHAVRIARETDLPPSQVPHLLTRLAHASLAAHRTDLGLRALDQAVDAAPKSERAHMMETRELARIGIALERGDTEEVVRRLRAVLAERRRRGQLIFLRNRPEVAAQLANVALEHGITPAFVQRLIEANHLKPPPGPAPAWPFRLRVRALGVLELARDGEVIRFTGKAQQRPIDLMKALVALGGVDVDEHQLTAMLWPDADGAAAKTSFDSTLLRLRRLLDIDQVLILGGGKLSLNKAIAWTDVWALDSTLEQAERARNAETAQHAARAVLSAYTGPLLASEESPWATKARDAIRSRFVRTLIRLGEALEHDNAWAAAVELYRRGLEADNLAEALYRGLMRALIATGEEAEAINVFRRCRQLLSIVLGMSPSPATERLHQQILSAHRPVQ
ncbi:MAG: BTAD domain-containing putative transcriptional regulator [Gemmatimonas sp.]